ncbi:MAG: response regulator [Deltaproteobacteria bacterium]|nr:response regulator [Deltaproteobacteria bacterium]
MEKIIADKCEHAGIIPKILIIEDDPEFSYYLKIILEEAGFCTELASDGTAGFQLLKSLVPDLITLDLIMPNKTGIKFFTEIRKNSKYCSIPVIIITSYTNNTYPGIDFKKALYSKALTPPDGYFEKPVESLRLISVIRNILASKSRSNSRSGAEAI